VKEEGEEDKEEEGRPLHLPLFPLLWRSTREPIKGQTATETAAAAAVVSGSIAPLKLGVAKYTL